MKFLVGNHADLAIVNKKGTLHKIMPTVQVVKLVAVCLALSRRFRNMLINCIGNVMEIMNRGLGPAVYLAVEPSKLLNNVLTVHTQEAHSFPIRVQDLASTL